MNGSTLMLSKMISFINSLPTSKIKIQQHPVMSQVESDQEHLSMMNPLDHEEFRRQGHMIIDFIANYYRDIEKYPVRSQVEPGYLHTRIPENAPYNPEPIETILQDVQNHIVPGLTHWLSPYHFAYYPANASIAASLGEILCTGFNVDGFNWIASPAATELENIVMDWLGKMLELPESFLFSGNGGGVIQGTTGDAVLCTVIAARDQLLNRIGRENILKLVVYGSDQTHCSLQKAAKIAGIHPNNVRSIKTTRSMAFALSPDSLRSAIISDKESGLIPLYLCATVGTTSSGAVDPVGPLCDVAGDYGIWIHIDAAYAGSACICPEFRHFIDGVEGANSFSFNPHKWLLTNLDCCCLWVKDPGALVSAFSTDSEYLKNTATDSKQVVDYKDWQVPLSRRFRAIKLWLVLRSYGVVNLRNYVRRHVEIAKHFEGLISMDKRFEVVVPRRFSLVCFRISPSVIVNGCPADDEESANELNRKLLKSLNDSGRVCMTHAIVGGMYMIRVSIGQPLTDYRHIEMAWKVVQEHTDAMLGSYLK